MSIETTNLPVVGRKYRNSGGTAGICVCESVCTRFGTVRFVSPDGEQYLIATNVWHTCWTEYDVAETQRTLQKLVDRIL